MTDYIYAGAATLIIFLSLLVGTKQKKELSDYIFIFWLLLLFVNSLSFIIIWRSNYPVSFAGRLIVEVSEASIFIHGPVFLFYTLSLTKAALKIKPRHLVHLIPFLVCLIILMAAIMVADGVSAITRQIVSICKMVSLLIYTTVVLIQLKNHRKQVETIFSNTENKYLNWLHFLAWGIIVVWILSSTGLILYALTWFRIPQYGGIMGNIAVCIFIFLVGFFGVKQEAIFYFTPAENSSIESVGMGDTAASAIMDHSLFTNVIRPEEKASAAAINEKYKNSGLSKQKSLDLFQVLENFMKTQKPYHDPELTLFGLAKQLDIHPNHLSQIINQHYSENFFDYINQYRINDVKDVLLSGKHDTFSLAGIGFECGFNSKASFNRAFKKFTGVTPSEFRKSAKS